MTTPMPYNEPVESYAPESPRRAALISELARQRSECPDIPAVVGAEQRRQNKALPLVAPHAHAHVLAHVYEASETDVADAIEAAVKAQRSWARLPFEERASVFLRAADLLTGRYREAMNAACMLGQSKTAFQAEIDSVCELADFFRWNVHFAERIAAEQPTSPRGQWNRLESRPLEGFVFAVSPFNFASIGVNLAAAPALLGNVVLWKPAHGAALASWLGLRILREAGLPDGVIQFIPGDGAAQARVALASEHLAGIHFTGSTNTFRTLWRGVAQNLDRYRTYPRLVGETGGKDFIVAHESADAAALAVAIVRGAFEYQGQKCSAPSRVYLPRSLWPEVRDRVVAMMETIRVGDPCDFSNFMGAVIDERAFDKIAGYLDLAHSTANVVHGGRSDKTDKREGYFAAPTFVETTDPRHRLMQEEVFGPVVTAYVYDESWEDVLRLVDSTSPYALTGAVFSREREPIDVAHDLLRNAAGNFYVNDKPTGAVVGQQPFGGGRASGTNDKAGSLWNLSRWASPRAIKETFDAPRDDYRYPFMK